MTILQPLFLIFFGHFLAATLVYLNHRFVFHGKLGKIKFLKKIKRYHTRHHQKPNSTRHLLMPFWARAMFCVVYAAVGWFISLWLMVGLASFSLYYAIYHYRIHKAGVPRHRYLRRSYHHHNLHHTVPTVNFSGMHPFIDKIFASYTESRPIL